MQINIINTTVVTVVNEWSTFKTKNVLCGYIGRRSNDIFTDAFFCIAGGQIQTFSKICLKKMIAKYSSL